MSDVEQLEEVGPAAIIAANEEQQLVDLKFAGEGEIFELGTVETKVVQLQQIAGQSIIEIGRLLSWTKERVGHGQFRSSLERMKIKKTQANAYMQVYEKIGKNPNVRPVGHLGISKALELVRNYEEEELEALASGEAVDGKTLDELAGMSRSELKNALRKEREAAKGELEAAQKQADALQKRNDKLAQQVERYESGSDGGWEFAAQWLEKMGAEMQQVITSAQRLEALAQKWTALIEKGDSRALVGHPFILSNLNQWVGYCNASVDKCADSLNACAAADHPEMSDLLGVAIGFTRNNLPSSMEFPHAEKEAEA